MAEREIRIDQSHCNYHLSQFLVDLGHHLVFRDAGRATRGGAGLQGKALEIFETRGWPIPDIITFIPPEVLLIVEIDDSFTKAQNSLQSYSELLTALEKAFDDVFRELQIGSVSRVELAFCKTKQATQGTKKALRKAALENMHVDHWFVFSQAGTPIMIEFDPEN